MAKERDIDFALTESEHFQVAEALGDKIGKFAVTKSVHLQMAKEADRSDWRLIHER